MRSLLILALASLFAIATVSAQLPKKPTWYDRAVKKLEVSFDPVEAKPGSTVTCKITIELNDGYHTYPTKQPEKAAADMTNRIKFPDPGAVIFVGTVTDPDKFETKSEPELGIRELRYYEGKVVYERKLVVSPSAKPGEVTVKLESFTLTVCDAKNCFPSKKLTPEAKFKVLDGPAVPVDPKYIDEVKKAEGK